MGMIARVLEFVRTSKSGDSFEDESVSPGSQELLEHFGRLGPDARRVLLSVAERMGRATVEFGKEFERNLVVAYEKDHALTGVSLTAPGEVET